MASTNPYTTPGSTLSDDQLSEYDPKMFSFSGRIGRLRYLAYISGLYVLMGVGGSVVVPMLPMASGAEGSILGFVVTALLVVGYVVMVILGFAFGKRRLNDLNRSGWWMLLYIIPIISLILLVYMIFFPGTNGSNDFGPAPSANTLLIKIFGWLLPVIFIVGILAAIAVPAYQEYLGRVQ